MDTKDLLRSGLARAWSSFEMTLDGLSDAELLLRPVDGANHLAWQLGHFVASEHQLGEMITTGSMPPLPEGFADRYTKETAADDDPAHFLSRAEYMSLYSAQREGLLEQLDKFGLTRGIFSRPYGTVDSLSNLKPSNKLLGYCHKVPPGQDLTQFDHDGTAESDGLRRDRLAKQPLTGRRGGAQRSRGFPSPSPSPNPSPQRCRFR
jgi:hypothetical protein